MRLSRALPVLLAALLVAAPAFAAKAPAGPKITNCSPNSGPATGGTTVAVNGSGFVSGAVVAFGSANAASTTFVSSTQLSAVTPAAAAGAVAVKVTNPNGTSAIYANGFTFLAVVNNVTCTWADPNDGAHPVISGEATTLRGTVNSGSETATYTWDFGDGSAPEPGAVTDPYAIEATHTYTGAVGATFTATLTVKDGATLLGTDTYKIAVAADTLATRKQIAIEKGLWYAHKNIQRDNAPPEHGGMPRGYINNWGNYYNGWDVPLNTMVTGTGFAENGFKANGSADNPYTEDMQRLVNYVTERLAIITVGQKGDGSPQFPYLNPEGRTGTMIDGLAVHFSPESETEYEYGIALRFLANCGYTTQRPATYDDSLNASTNASASIRNWTITQIVQQMIDFFAWAQLYDKGNNYDNYQCWLNNPDTPEAYWECGRTGMTKSDKVVPDNRRGSWPYFSEGYTGKYDYVTNTWEDFRGAYGETVLAYWVVTGLRFAEKQGCVWPTFVKTELDRYLQRNQDLVAGSPFYGEFHFGEAYGHHLVERAGQALVLLKWIGRKNNNTQVVAAKNYINNLWGRHNYEHRQGYPWSMRGENQCTSEIDNVTADDCYSHFSLTQDQEFGHWGPSWACQYECLGEQLAPPAYDHVYRDEPLGSGKNWNWYYDIVNTGCTIVGPSCIEGTRYQNGSIWVVEARTNQVNIFGMLSIAEGLGSIGVTTGFPTTDTMSWQERYLHLMIDNQLPSGMWNDRGWVWDSAFGTGWALMILPNL